MKTKEQILERMSLYRIEGGGIGSWLTKDTCSTIFERLGRLDEAPLSAAQLNQLLVLGHEAPVSLGYFRYYWLEAPQSHPYDVADIPDCASGPHGGSEIQSLDHLAWGLHRLYIDGLLYYGSVRTAFRDLRNRRFSELQDIFAAKRMDTAGIKRRGPPLCLHEIAEDQRYLIAEIACNSYGINPAKSSKLFEALRCAFKAHEIAGGGATTIECLLSDHLPPELVPSRNDLKFSASGMLKAPVASEADIEEQYAVMVTAFSQARDNALKNTDYYLSMLTDLDVYVATSMREPEHFTQMARTCKAIFSDPRLAAMHLRYFDPTMSAAPGHEDKGLIECLMVKCAKALVYCAGASDSYGKDAEAAMALSLGRPVIFYCEDHKRAQFYRDVHPLTRLIEFKTGVAVGAMVVENDLNQVAELLARIFQNRMRYCLKRAQSSDSLLMREELTGSVVRLLTSNKLLMETFWNHYHQERRQSSDDAIPEKVRATVTKIPDKALRRTPEDQPSLPLEETDDLVRKAARAAPSVRSVTETKNTAPQSPSAQHDRLALSTDELFDAISIIKRSSAVGRNRFQVFETWLEAEHIGQAEQIQLLRFIETTLQHAKKSARFVYTGADLSRWYRQMSDGEVVGIVG
jgi:hypothetical protein